MDFPDPSVCSVFREISPFSFFVRDKIAVSSGTYGSTEFILLAFEQLIFFFECALRHHIEVAYSAVL